MTLTSAGILLFLVMDPFGNVPFFLCILKDVPPERRQKVIARELVVALLVLLAALVAGPFFLAVLQVSKSSLHIAGGIVLFLIAVKMVFGQTIDLIQGNPEGDPFIVPMAIPAVAGPSAIATILLLIGQEPGRWPEWMLSLLLAWSLCALILMLSSKLSRILGDRGLIAIERLMGLVLTIVSVEMFMLGLSVVLNGEK